VCSSLFSFWGTAHWPSLKFVTYSWCVLSIGGRPCSHPLFGETWLILSEDRRGQGSAWGNDFWMKAWTPSRTPDSCLFSSPLTIEPDDLDQRGWHNNCSRHLHVLLTCHLPLTCQLSTINQEVLSPAEAARIWNAFCHCTQQTQSEPENPWCLVTFTMILGSAARMRVVFRKTSNSNSNSNSNSSNTSATPSLSLFLFYPPTRPSASLD
jgi:hypothetical protein